MDDDNDKYTLSDNDVEDLTVPLLSVPVCDAEVVYRW